MTRRAGEFSTGRGLKKKGGSQGEMTLGLPS